MTNATGSQSESVGRAPAIRARPPDRTAQSDKVSMSLPRMVLSILLGISALALLASCAPGQSYGFLDGPERMGPWHDEYGWRRT
jgi:hypothetical protein